MGRRVVMWLVILLVALLIYQYFQYQKKTTVPSNPAPTPKVISQSSSSAVLNESTNALCHARQVNPNDLQAILPDPTCTPGTTNPEVTQETISSTICKSGYTKTIRPPASFTTKLKRSQIEDYGYADTRLSSYEEDHMISLELGGNPADPKNLWPEPHGSPNEKDRVENYLNDLVCSGKMTLLEAQKEISTNWYDVYKSMDSY